jgi:exodeoxyribonuclease V gamma subunit
LQLTEYVSERLLYLVKVKNQHKLGSMSLRLFFSNDISVLAEQFDQILKKHSKDPFAPPRVITPGTHIHKWLQLRVAEKNGIVLGIQREFIESFLWNSLNPKENQKVLNVAVLQQKIHLVLNEIAHGQNEKYSGDFKPIQKFLHIKDAKPLASRLIQLSARLANLFLEYDLNRPSVFNAQGEQIVPGIDVAWSNADSPTFYFNKDKESVAQKTEEWQIKLWNYVFQDEAGTIKTKTQEYLTLPALFRRQIKAKNILKESASHSEIILFNPGGMSHFHRNYLLLLSEKTPITVLQLNPCSDFWEDVDTRRSKKCIYSWDNQKPLLSFSDPGNYQKEEYHELTFSEAKNIYPPPQDDMRLLELWGQTGKENITLWCQATNYDFEFLESDEPGTGSLLNSLRHLVLNRIGQPDQKVLADDSIQVWNCPDPLRECEQVRDNIQKLLRADTRLTLQDFLILIPDPDKYRSSIHRVFGADTLAGKIPYVIGDENAGASLFSAAVSSFLSLSGSSFSRSKVLGFLRNPLVLNALNISRDDLAIWESWCDNLNIFHGYNLEQRQKSGDNEPSALHSWQWGIERLITGTISDSLIQINPNPDEEGLRLPYCDMESNDTAVIEKLADTIQSLFKDLNRFEIPAGKDMKSRITQSEILFRKWIKTGNDFQKEQIVESSFYDSLSLLNLQDEFSEESNEHLADQDQFKEYLRSLLNSELPGRSTLFTGRLCFQKFKPGSVLPHKIIYLMGMNGSDFPGVQNHSTLDLMNSKRIIGDLNPVRQKQYLFLEALVCAKQKLIMSWQGENIQKDEELAPSSCIIDLITYLDELVLENKFEIKKTPLIEYESLKDKDILKSDIFNPISKTIAHIKKEFPKKYLSNLLKPQNGDDEQPQAAAPITDLRDICRFICEPQTWYIRKVAGLWAVVNDSDPAVKEWEDLKGNGLQKWKLSEEIISGTLETFPNFNDNQIQDVLKNAVLKGESPQGTFKNLWLKSYQKSLTNTKDLTEQLLKDTRINNLEKNFRISELCEDQNHLTVSDSKSDLKFQIKGEIRALNRNEKSITLIDFSASECFKSKKWKESKIDKLLLAWLQSLVIRAFSEQANTNIHFLFSDKNDIYEIPLNPIDPQNPKQSSIQYLHDVLSLMYPNGKISAKGFFEAPLIGFYDMRDELSEGFEWLRLQAWIEDQADNFGPPDYKRADELKISTQNEPEADQWKQYCKLAILPFLNSISEAKNG